MSTMEWFALGSLAVAALAVILSSRRGAKQDTTSEAKAFTRLEVKLDSLKDEVTAMGRKLEHSTAAWNVCDRDIALLKRDMADVKDRLDQHLQTHPPNVVTARRKRTTNTEGA